MRCCRYSARKLLTGRFWSVSNLCRRRNRLMRLSKPLPAHPRGMSISTVLTEGLSPKDAMCRMRVPELRCQYYSLADLIRRRNHRAVAGGSAMKVTNNSKALPGLRSKGGRSTSNRVRPPTSTSKASILTKPSALHSSGLRALPRLPPTRTATVRRRHWKCSKWQRIRTCSSCPSSRRHEAAPRNRPRPRRTRSSLRPKSWPSNLDNQPGGKLRATLLARLPKLSGLLVRATTPRITPCALWLRATIHV
jgi:hypothetical protein